jgi:hypothetical protein
MAASGKPIRFPAPFKRKLAGARAAWKRIWKKAGSFVAWRRDRAGMNAFARHLSASGWQAVRHDPDAGILTLPWSGTWNGTRAVLTGGTCGLGWFVQPSTCRVAPAFAGIGHDGAPFHLSREDGLLPLKFALKELAAQSLQAASRVICHDLGSSLMGLDGLLGIWGGAEPPEKAAFAEDYASIQ